MIKHRLNGYVEIANIYLRRCLETVFGFPSDDDLSCDEFNYKNINAAPSIIYLFENCACSPKKYPSDVCLA
jgi:hypothetical protein